MKGSGNIIKWMVKELQFGVNIKNILVAIKKIKNMDSAFFNDQNINALKDTGRMVNSMGRVLSKLIILKKKANG